MAGLRHPEEYDRESATPLLDRAMAAIHETRGRLFQSTRGSLRLPELEAIRMHPRTWSDVSTEVFRHYPIGHAERACALRLWGLEVRLDPSMPEGEFGVDVEGEARHTVLGVDFAGGRDHTAIVVVQRPDGALVYSDDDGRSFTVTADMRAHLPLEAIVSDLERIWPGFTRRVVRERSWGQPRDEYLRMSNGSVVRFVPPPPPPPPPSNTFERPVSRLSREELRKMHFNDWLQRAADEIETAQRVRR